MTEEERLELERLRLGAAGQRASDDYEAMVNVPSNKVNIPSLGQPGNALEYARPLMPSIESVAPALEPIPSADEVALPQQGVALSSDPGSLFPTPIADSVGQADSGLFAIGQNPMLKPQSLNPENPFIAVGQADPVTAVDLMGRPLREQPPVEEIRRRSDADLLGGDSILYGNLEEGRAAREGFVEGLKRVFTDFSGEKLRQRERYAPRDVDPNPPIAFTPPPVLADTRNPFFQAPIDILGSGTVTTGATEAPSTAPIELEPLTRNNTPEATFLRADGSIGEIFPGQRIGDAFPGNPDTPLVGSPLVPGQETYQGADLPGGTGFVRAPEGMVKTIGPDGRMIFATPEQANAMAPTATAPTTTAPTATAATATGADGFTEPTRTGSRAGRFFDDVKGFFREGISGAGGLYDYFTDPNSPTLESIYEGRKENLEAARQADERARTGSVRLGELGSIQRNFADRMATGQPLTQAETAAALEFARSKGLNFDPRTGYSQGTMATAPQVTGVGSRMMTAEFRDANQDGIEDRSQGIFNPGDFRGSGANLPTLSSVNAMSGTAPQGRPALSAYEQASMDREAGIAARDGRPGETSAQRDTRIAQSRTQGSSQGGISQADARDLAQGMAKGATEGERMRALQIQSRLGLGTFRPRTPRVDKLSQATSMVDRMISSGQLSPEKRNAAIQKIVGLGAGSGAAGSADAGVIGSAEFDRVASQLQEGGSLYNMGIRVDPSVVDPLTGAAQIYREKPGLEFGPPERLPVSQELLQQLLPYARSVRQGGTMTQDFTNMGMQVNQFAGSR